MPKRLNDESTKYSQCQMPNAQSAKRSRVPGNKNAEFWKCKILKLQNDLSPERLKYRMPMRKMPIAEKPNIQSATSPKC